MYMYEKCIEWLILYSALHYVDQGICQLEVKLLGEESLPLGSDWPFYSSIRSSASHDFLFFLLCSTLLWRICQLGVKLLAKESQLWGIDWSVTVNVGAVHLMIICFLCSALLWSRYKPVSSEAFFAMTDFYC